jgi:short-subunit dehydrogenase
VADDQTVAVVTGGASGIGLALAREAAKRSDVVVIADIDEGALQAAARELDGGDAEIRLFPVDLRDADQVDDLADECRKLGTVTLACLNAGVSATGDDLWQTPAETVRFLLDVNVIGTANSIRSLVPTMVGQSTPSAVVITGSMAGMVTSAQSGAYSASKAATVALAKALRAELAAAAPQVHVSLCCPGMVQTNLMRTSARAMPQLMAGDLVEATHGALNEFGIPAEEQARRILSAVDEKRFWVLPPSGDPFADLLAAELEEQRQEVAG